MPSESPRRAGAADPACWGRRGVGCAATMTRTVRRVGIAAGVLVASWLAAGWVGSSMAMRPPWYPGRSLDGTLPVKQSASWHGIDTDPGAEFGIAFEDVSFPAEDGQTLRGWFVSGAAEGLVLRRDDRKLMAENDPGLQFINGIGVNLAGP